MELSRQRFREIVASVANGLVYIGTNDSKVYAFDAAGQSGCSGTPKTCRAAVELQTGATVFSAPAIANGFVYAGSTLQAFGLP